MSFTFDVVYRGPIDTEKERRIEAIAQSFGGIPACGESCHPFGPSAIVLTYGFDAYASAYHAAAKLRTSGFMVDGPRDEED